MNHELYFWKTFQERSHPGIEPSEVKSKHHTIEIDGQSIVYAYI